MPRQLTQSAVEEWVALAGGKFTVRDIWSEIGIESLEGKKHLRIILARLEKKGVLVANRDGSFRKLDLEVEELNWQDADPDKILPIKFPFELERYCRIYPQSIIIVAGSKNAGKSAFLYNFIKLNMDAFNIDLFNSETGRELMLERFTPLQIPKPAPFRVITRYDHFSDVIHPEHISVIDYLDIDSEFYLIGAEIKAIFRKLTTGIAVIGLQKPPGRDLAIGGIQSAKAATLYIALDNNKLKLVYVKVPPKGGKVDPTNMTWTFLIDKEDGVHFRNIQRFYGEQ